MTPESTVGGTLMVTCVRPSPTRSRVTWVPAPATMLPPLLVIAPLFHTVCPTRPTPPAPAVIVPLLRTWCDGLASPLKPLNTNWPVVRPLMKSPAFIHSVEATMPPTLTCALLPKAMPAGLMMNTLPLLVSVPSICDALVEYPKPTTRFKVTLLAPNCWSNVTP